jgi:hypothetical protein
LQVVGVYYKIIDPNSNAVGDRYLPLVGIISLVIVIALLNYFRRNSLTTYDKIYKQETTDGMEI